MPRRNHSFISLASSPNSSSSISGEVSSSRAVGTVSVIGGSKVAEEAPELPSMNSGSNIGVSVGKVVGWVGNWLVCK